MVCYTGTEAKEKLRGIPVEVVYEGDVNNNSRDGKSLALLLLLGGLLLLLAMEES